ncbi:hypothetical protein OHA21_13330 [Actinoplanes sp. NBC_00393]|uniref:hypothetical protein n=1 Tax=Actinoplanes sp. NBC_00393 TaxID=2975953 RepID=UPI002E24435F
MPTPCPARRTPRTGEIAGAVPTATARSPQPAFSGEIVSSRDYFDHLTAATGSTP